MERSVLELLENAAVKYAGKIAAKDTERECTFAQLCDNARKIGSALGKRHISGRAIPVFMEKSVMTLESFWGVVYAGGCYSLINPAQPKERVEKILDILNPP